MRRERQRLKRQPPEAAVKRAGGDRPRASDERGGIPATGGRRHRTGEEIKNVRGKNPGNRLGESSATSPPRSRAVVTVRSENSKDGTNGRKRRGHGSRGSFPSIGGKGSRASGQIAYDD